METLNHIADVIGGGGGALLISAAFRALPEPTAESAGFYHWFYRFGQLLFASGKPPETRRTTPPAPTIQSP